MSALTALIKRNTKLFFKDRGMFFTSLITPVILLVLYATFLASIFRDSFKSAFPIGLAIPDKLLNALVGGQLVSSILAVSCVTVAFSSNMRMIQDKFTGSRNDLIISPVKSEYLALGYYIASMLATLMVCLAAALVGLAYLGVIGWYLNAGDVALLLLDVVLMVLFGTALSSIIHFFLSTQGQATAVGTIVSAGYGFICGAYMPISNFSSGLQKVLTLLPGTYGTSIIRNHCLNGPLRELKDMGLPNEAIDSIRDAVDCNLYFFGDKVELGTKYLIIICTLAVLIGAYVLINRMCRDKT